MEVLMSDRAYLDIRLTLQKYLNCDFQKISTCAGVMSNFENILRNSIYLLTNYKHHNFGLQPVLGHQQVSTKTYMHFKIMKIHKKYFFTKCHEKTSTYKINLNRVQNTLGQIQRRKLYEHRLKFPYFHVLECSFNSKSLKHRFLVKNKIIYIQLKM